jgi:superfamily II DNA/RNA helicase
MFHGSHLFFLLSITRPCMQSFRELGLHHQLLANLAKQNILLPTSIQSKVDFLSLF